MKLPSNQDNINEWSSVTNEIIDNFGDEGDFTRQVILNPILLKILGDVKGKVILDAGCGTGYLSRMLAKRGAVVTGIEPSLNLFTYASNLEQEKKQGINYLQRDLSNFTEHVSYYDFVVANMVMMDIYDYKPAIINCINSLKLGGSLIISILHPCFETSTKEWVNNGKRSIVSDYFTQNFKKQNYGYLYHRPISNYLNLLIEHDLSLTHFVEPQLSPELAREYPEAEKDLFIPSILVLAAKKI
jgi:2-polyprenyl-3-methyl-5-hydroxy-6-metoxy-1,4-benzoquinol methylase